MYYDIHTALVYIDAYANAGTGSISGNFSYNPLTSSTTTEKNY